MNKITVISCIMTFMFVLSGIDKLKNLTKVSQGLKKRVVNGLQGLGVPLINLPSWFYKLSILGAALLQLVGSIIIILSTTNLLNKYMSVKNKKLLGNALCIAIVIFTILATLLYHFPPKGSHYYAFISNVTTVGGFLLLGHTISN